MDVDPFHHLKTKKSSFISKIFHFNPFRSPTESSPYVSPSQSLNDPQQLPKDNIGNTRDSPSMRRRSGSPKRRHSRAGSVLSWGQRPRRREQTWSGPSTLDHETSEKLREFYIRNREANDRDAEQLERRNSIWNAFKQVPLREQVTDLERRESELMNEEPEVGSTRTVGELPDLETIIFEATSGEFGSQRLPPSSSSTFSQRSFTSNGVPFVPPLLRKTSSIQPTEEALEACVALQRFAATNGYVLNLPIISSHYQ